jgi:DNA repair protein RadC
MEFRVFEKPAIETPFSFSSPKDVYEKMKGYQKADREFFFLLFLDTKNHCINIETHSIGSVDSSAVYPREVFRSALLKNATSVIFVHNHPGGDPEPSESDKAMTRQLVFCSSLLGINVLDHVILGDDGKFFSFADQGFIGDYEAQANKSI